MGTNSNLKNVENKSEHFQKSLLKSEYEERLESIQEKLLYDELDKNGYKYNKNNVVFITTDNNGNIIWLEDGRDNVGLKHILNRHTDDFKNAFGVSSSEIPDFIKFSIHNGEIVKVLDNGDGITNTYYIKRKDYLIVAIGYNGFIVTAFPFDDKKGVL